MCQGFNHFSVFFASFCIGQISHKQHLCVSITLEDQHMEWKPAGQPEHASLNQCQLIVANRCSGHPQQVVITGYGHSTSIRWSVDARCDSHTDFHLQQKIEYKSGFHGNDYKKAVYLV